MVPLGNEPNLEDCTVEAMPKPVYATADELAEAVKKLEGQVRVEMLPADGRDWPRGQIHCV